MLYTRLQVFLSVSKNLSFTKASRELCITQPAITKHIAKLEEFYNVKLFERHGNKISLTQEGLILKRHSEKIKSLFNELSFAMSLINKQYTGKIRLGASTTIAQYILPIALAKLSNDNPTLDISLITDNSENIEKALISHDIDIGFVENASRNVSLDYKGFLDDTLVLIASAKNEISSLSLEKLKSCPLVLREVGSGTLDVIEAKLSEHNLKLSDFNVKMHLGSTEAIKLFIQNSKCFAIVSLYSIKRELYEHTLKIVELENIIFKRQFNIVKNIGDRLDYMDKFIDFIKENINNI